MVSKNPVGTFVRTVREGDIVFIVQRFSNVKGRFILVQEIHRGGQLGSIIIPEGRNESGWCGLGSNSIKHLALRFPNHGPLGLLRTQQVWLATRETMLLSQ